MWCRKCERVLGNNHYATFINVHSNHGIPTLWEVIFNAFWANILFSFNTFANAWQCPFVCQYSSPNNFNMHENKKHMACCMHLQVRVGITWWRINIYRIICPPLWGESTGCRQLSPDYLYIPLRWRHNERDGVSNHQPHSGEDQRKHQSSASLAFVREIHRWPVNSPNKRPVTRKMFPFDDVFMQHRFWCSAGLLRGESTGDRWTPLTKDQ